MQEIENVISPEMREQIQQELMHKKEILMHYLLIDEEFNVNEETVHQMQVAKQQMTEAYL